jgi:hypothetical protein
MWTISKFAHIFTHLQGRSLGGAKGAADPGQQGGQVDGKMNILNGRKFVRSTKFKLWR